MATPPSSSSFLKAKGASDQLFEVRQPCGAAQCLSGDEIPKTHLWHLDSEVLSSPGLRGEALLLFVELHSVVLFVDGFNFHCVFFYIIFLAFPPD